MRKLAALFFAGILIAVANYTTAQSCCQRPAGNDMKALALNKSFKAAHEAPLPLDYTAKSGSMIKFKTSHGSDGHAFYVPADETTDKVLFIFHEWWGLNDYIKREAEKWQQELGGHVAVYAVDLYDGKVATTADEAGKLMNALDQQRGEAIINGLIKKVGDDKKIATLGWCMGGSWAFTGSVCSGGQALGCVMYYGFPEKDATRIKSEKANVLYIYGTQDNFIKLSDVKAFGNALAKSGHGFTLQSYDAPHAFANPSNPKYNEQAAEGAHALALAFLKNELSLK